MRALALFLLIAAGPASAQVRIHPRGTPGRPGAAPPRRPAPDRRAHASRRHAQRLAADDAARRRGLQPLRPQRDPHQQRRARAGPDLQLRHVRLRAALLHGPLRTRPAGLHPRHGPLRRRTRQVPVPRPADHRAAPRALAATPPRRCSPTSRTTRAPRTGPTATTSCSTTARRACCSPSSAPRPRPGRGASRSGRRPSTRPSATSSTATRAARRRSRWA